MKFVVIILLVLPIVYSQLDRELDLYLYSEAGCRGTAQRRNVPLGRCTEFTPFHALSASVSGNGCGMHLWNSANCSVGGYHWIACNTCTNVNLNVQGVKEP